MQIIVEPDAWASIICIGPEYGKVVYGKLPIQSLNPLYYTYEKLYSEKSVIGLMKAAYYNGYTEREQELRDMPNVKVRVARFWMNYSQALATIRMSRKCSAGFFVKRPSVSFRCSSTGYYGYP